MTAPTAGYPMCSDRLAACVCTHPAGHDGPHVCTERPARTIEWLGIYSDRPCGGSWGRNEDGSVTIHRMPAAYR